MRVLCGCVVLAILGAEVLASTKPELDDVADGATKTQTKSELELAEVKSELKLAKAEVTKEHSSKQAMEETLAKQEKSIASLKAESKSKDAESKSKDAEMKKLKLEAESKSKDAESLQADSNARVAEIVQLKLDATTQATSITEKNTKLDALEASITEKNTKLDALEASITEKTTKLDALGADKKALKTNLLKETAKVKAQDEAISELQTQAQDLEKEHVELAKQHALLKSQYADPSVQHFLRAKAVKVYSHPGISGASNKTFTYVLPSLQAKYAKGKQLAEASQSAVYSKLHAYVGSEKTEPWLPAISGGLVYGAVIVPFFCTVCCLTRVICRLRPILLFIHLDFMITTLCAGIFAVYNGRDPLAAFADHDPSVYLFTQAASAIVFCVYLTLLCLACCCASGYERIYRCVQIWGAGSIFAIYFMYVWTPAMMDQMPHMESVVGWIVGPGAAVSQFAWLPYLPVSALFLLLLCLERLAWIGSGKRGPDEMSVVMRNDIELASVIGDVAYSPVTQKAE